MILHKKITSVLASINGNQLFYGKISKIQNKVPHQLQKKKDDWATLIIHILELKSF